MSKLTQNEAQTWGVAYAIALALLTIGSSSQKSLDEDVLDGRAKAIADRALKTLKEKKVI